MLLHRVTFSAEYLCGAAWGWALTGGGKWDGGLGLWMALWVVVGCEDREEDRV